MLPQKHNDLGIWVVIFIILFFLVGNFIFTQYEILQIKNIALATPATVFITPFPTINSMPTTLTNQTSAPTPSSTSSPKTSSYQTPVPQNLVTYIPITGGSTQNTNWTDIPGTGFTLNIGDYGSKVTINWDANLRVDNANGETFARIFDTTHSIAVDGSQIQISNTSTSTDVISGNLNFWQGNNNYVIQLQSLNGSTAFIDSGKIKITY